MNSNPNGRLAVYVNSMGKFFGEKVFAELSQLVEDENARKRTKHDLLLQRWPDHLRPAMEHVMEHEYETPPEFVSPKLDEFPDTNQRPVIEDLVRGQDAYLVQWLITPPGASGEDRYRYSADRLAFEFFKTIDALRHAGVKRLSLVTPYAYDSRKDIREGRDAVGSLTFCKALDGIIRGERMQAFCLDLHAQQIEGFYQAYNINMDSVPMFDVFVDHINSFYPEIVENSIVLAPDLGSTKRARNFSERLGAPVVIIDKRRVSPTKVIIEALAAGGVDPKGKKILLFDDVLASGGTAIEGTEYLQKKRSAGEVYWFMTHPSMTNMEKLDSAYNRGVFKRIFTADTVPLPKREYLEQVNTSRKIAQLIWNIHTDKSVGSYLDTK
ncbi:MAG: ribose-phosphate diphosphokinase [Candidatus Woesearchaeota archaeon]